MKASVKRPKPSKLPHTLEFDQSYVVPPHCSAMRRHTNAAIRKEAPRMSILAIFCFNDKD